MDNNNDKKSIVTLIFQILSVFIKPIFCVGFGLGLIIVGTNLTWHSLPTWAMLLGLLLIVGSLLLITLVYGMASDDEDWL